MTYSESSWISMFPHLALPALPSSPFLPVNTSHLSLLFLLWNPGKLGSMSPSLHSLFFLPWKISPNLFKAPSSFHSALSSKGSLYVRFYFLYCTCDTFLFVYVFVACLSSVNANSLRTRTLFLPHPHSLHSQQQEQCPVHIRCLLSMVFWLVS